MSATVVVTVTTSQAKPVPGVVAEFTAGSETSRRLLSGLRSGVLLITTTILVGLSLPSLVAGLPAYRPAWAQLAAWGGYLMIVTAETVLLATGRSWGRLRWPALAVATTAAVISLLSMPAAGVATAADWSYGVIGWIGVVLLLERPLGEACGFFALAQVITTIGMLAQPHDELQLLGLLSSAITSIGFPLCAVVAGTALKAVARSAATAAEQSEQVRTAEAVAAGLHASRRRRFAAFEGTAVPLLRGLSDGTLAPHDEQVRRRCAIEAARMRRLFAEIDDAVNPLLYELRHCADIADRRDVVVELETSGQWPDPPVETRRALTEAPLAALATASS